MSELQETRQGEGASDAHPKKAWAPAPIIPVLAISVLAACELLEEGPWHQPPPCLSQPGQSPALPPPKSPLAILNRPVGTTGAVQAGWGPCGGA